MASWKSRASAQLNIRDLHFAPSLTLNRSEKQRLGCRAKKIDRRVKHFTHSTDGPRDIRFQRSTALERTQWRIE
jgi:hypothetical protein